MADGMFLVQSYCELRVSVELFSSDPLPVHILHVQHRLVRNIEKKH